MGAHTSCCKKEEVAEVSNVVQHVVHQSDREFCQEHHEHVPDPILTAASSPSLVPSELGSFQQTLPPELSVDPALLRGISLRKSLRRFGRVWMTNPSQLTARDNRRLLKASVKVDFFDVFVSRVDLNKF